MNTLCYQLYTIRFASQTHWKTLTFPILSNVSGFQRIASVSVVIFLILEQFLIDMIHENENELFRGFEKHNESKLWLEFLAGRLL